MNPQSIVSNTNYFVAQVLSPNYNNIHHQYESAMSSTGGSNTHKQDYVEVMQHVVIADMNGQELLPSNVQGVSQPYYMQLAPTQPPYSQYQQQYASMETSNVQSHLDEQNAYLNPLDTQNYNNNNADSNNIQVMKQSSDRDILELLLESGVLNEDEDVLMSYTPSVNALNGSRWPENKGMECHIYKICIIYIVHIT